MKSRKSISSVSKGQSQRSTLYTIQEEGHEVHIELPATQSIVLDQHGQQMRAWRICTIKAFAFMTLQYLMQTYV